MRLAWLLALLWLSTAVAAEPVQLVFVGDIMLDDGPGKTIAAGGDPLAAFDGLLRAADFSIGNLECPVAASGTALENKIYSFRADPAVMRVLRGRFHALSVANNHSGDQGRAAFLETLDHVRAAGIRPFGGGRNLREAHQPLWLEKHGVKIAILAYNEFKPRSFEAGADWPGIAWSEDSHVLADIRAARAAGADVVIPFMHWCWENEPQASPRQRQLARLMIDAGADAVVGGHPHVTQGTDRYRGKPIVWSLGNFVFDGFKPGPGRIGWLLRMTVDRRGVRDWDIVEAQIDEAGTPHPAGAQDSALAGRRPR
jgi:poly-gamma-glutamate capsule biosynthesis protein CapA/YwtB (metallophosphatase superfamily)